ncbi:1-phosphofructokinase family hexose kinase [Rhodovulum sp. 12E13]|uniref:1-phosphofructokinase family hexose kinase n=1 Tax=Rhodovulum sp. 12E13 TaxID=2203891 RepID=UPI000E128DA1|nr:1-phosphofructokinase family hexose kinase [Rhodovulum sp. 12E13]RDC68058.1 1-phosphofructokinase family hexose kinase [Rhodovulum sp. 12E13]
MTPILTLTLNPTVDYATSADEILADVKLRCSEPHVDPGGGGINVSRAILMLEGQSTALVSIGGGTGARLLELLALEGVPTVAFQGPGDTRISFSVTETGTGRQYRFVTPGPVWGEADVARALATVDRAAHPGSYVVLSGSQPPGVAKDFPKLVADHVEGHRARLVVDTSGPALRNLVEAPHEPLHVLRTDDVEAEEIAGRALPAPQDTARFASELVARGVAHAVIFARGAEGSVLATADGAWLARPAPVREVSKVGAGDSFVGAFTLALERGDEMQEALRYGVAASAAAVATEATRLCPKSEVDRLLPHCTVEALAA